MRNLVILISGAGSNMEALVQACRRDDWQARWGVRIACVISNRPDAPGLARARELGLVADVVDHRGFSSRAAFDVALMQRIDAHAPALVLLAGFMRILTPDFVRHYAGRLLNIHPSLLPAFPGLHTHRRAIAAGCRVTGATVHWVSDAVDGVEGAGAGDHGSDTAIIDQAVVPVLPDDDEDRLAARVLAQEHRLYPQAVCRVLARLSGQALAGAAAPAGRGKAACTPDVDADAAPSSTATSATLESR